MYCKKCGRKLEEGMRYCDRCGQSVKQNQNTGVDARRKEAEELKKERLNRKQKLQEKEQEKKEKKAANKKQTNILATVFVVLFCILVIAIITFMVASKKSEDAPWRTQDGSVKINATDIPAQTPAPTDKNGKPIPTAPAATAYAVTGEINKDGYREYLVDGNLTFTYPATFEQQRTDNDAKLSLYDKSGGASISLNDEAVSVVQAKSLMSDFAKAQTGKVTYSRAGNDWYIIEVAENDIIYHRKCVIINNKAISYDFSYSTTSSCASAYKQQIEYMDSHFSL